MSTATLSPTRLTALLQRWTALAGPAADASSGGTAQQYGALFCVFGEMSSATLGNQRGQAVLQYLFDLTEPATNGAVLLTKAATVVVVPDKDKLTAPTGPIGGAVPGQEHRVTVVSLADAAGALRPLVMDATVGAALKEMAMQEGTFAAGVIAALKAEVDASRLVEAAPFIGELLFVKDDAALGCVEKAAGLCSAVFRRFARQAIEDQIQSSSPISLHDLRERLCEKLERPNTIPDLESLSVAEFGLATGLTPCVFHKGTYVGQIQVEPAELQAATSAPVRGDVLVIRYGEKNNGYTAFFARTLIVKSKAPSDAEAAYEFVYQVSEKLLKELVPGTPLRDVYAETAKFARELNPVFAEHLPKSLGFSTGLLVLESRGTISEKATSTVQDGMSFVTRVTLENLPDGANGQYAVELSDTVIVRNGVAELKTKVARKTSDITYQDEDEGDVGGDAGDAFELNKRDLSKITRQGQSATVIISREAQRDENLKKLLRELHAEFLAAGGKKGTQVPTEELRIFDLGRLSFGEVYPFSSTDRVPPAECSGGKMLVQAEKRVVWLPLFGTATPFHISTISKIDSKLEGSQYTLSVQFHSLQEANVSYKLNRTKVFLKELNYSSSTDVFEDVVVQVQSIQKRIKNDEVARKRSATTASSGKLIVGKIYGLPQVKLRPPVNVGRQNKGCVGNLELHQNGLRFSFLGGAPIDILFEDVKHCIFQPAVQEISVIYHVTLKKAIEVGRKAVTELQFIAEVMESNELVSGSRRSYEEEMNAELRDERRATETNKQFIRFAKAVEEKSHIKTQLPTKSFYFDGVHTRSMVKFRGSSEVLWAVSDWPAFTLSVAEVEVVSLERVIPGGSTFDVSFVLKDYNKPVVAINSIPKQFLEGFKDWCLSARLYYMETTVNPNWKVTLKDIREDAEWDPWKPGEGWSVLNNDGDDEEDEEGDSESESDSTYYEDEDEEESDSDDSSWLEDEESDAETDEDSDASSAVSWDELERKAQEHDRKRSFSDDDDERPKKRQRPTEERAGGANTGPRTNSGPVPPARPPGGASYGKTAVPPPRRF